MSTPLTPVAGICGIASEALRKDTSHCQALRIGTKRKAMPAEWRLNHHTPGGSVFLAREGKRSKNSRLSVKARPSTNNDWPYTRLPCHASSRPAILRHAPPRQHRRAIPHATANPPAFITYLHRVIPHPVATT
jgi:hypothetical protein